MVREGDSVRDNCNTCKCEVSETHQGCMDILCSTYQCVLETSVYEELEQGYQNGEYLNLILIFQKFSLRFV